MKFLVVIIAMFSTVFAWAGAVEWNTVYKVATYDCDNVLLWYSEDASSSARLNIGLYLNWNAQGEISLSGAKYGSGLGDVFVGNVLSAVLGEIIHEETTRNLESYFCHDKLDYQEHAKTYPIAVETGADYYLICIGGVFI